MAFRSLSKARLLLATSDCDTLLYGCVFAFSRRGKLSPGSGATKAISQDAFSVDTSQNASAGGKSA